MTDTDPLAFLGEEFLTWLWYRLENEGGDFKLDQGRSIGVSLDDFIAFAPRDDDETEQTLRKGLPTRSPEASAALRHGRRLRRAKLVVAEGEDVWSTVIDGPTMNLLSIKLPEDDPDAENIAERGQGRIDAFLRLQDHIAALYRAFLEVRLESGYLEQGAAEQATWMATR